MLGDECDTPKAPRQPQRWTEAEDELLRNGVLAQMAECGVRDWKAIASSIPGRTNKDCRKRWHNAVAGGLKKGHWTQEEDHLLSLAVQLYGERWTTAAEVVQTRSADQCAKRWTQYLDPQLDRGEWSQDENRILLKAFIEKGSQWKEIQQEYFPTRSRNSIKNQYTILSRRIRRRKPLDGRQKVGSKGDGVQDNADRAEHMVHNQYQTEGIVPDDGLALTDSELSSLSEGLSNYDGARSLLNQPADSDGHPLLSHWNVAGSSLNAGGCNSDGSMIEPAQLSEWPYLYALPANPAELSEEELQALCFEPWAHPHFDNLIDPQHRYTLASGLPGHGKL